MRDLSEAELEHAWVAQSSHVHSIGRCDHALEGDEVHWLCGMTPTYTNIATARAVGDVLLEAPLGVTYLREHGGDPVVVTDEVKAIADAILRAGLGVGTDTHKIVNAVWDASAILDVVALAGLEVRRATDS